MERKLELRRSPPHPYILVEEDQSIGGDGGPYATLRVSDLQDSMDEVYRGLLLSSSGISGPFPNISP